MAAAKTKVSPKKTAAKKAATKKPAARSTALKNAPRAQAAKNRITNTDKAPAKSAPKAVAKKPVSKNPPTDPAPKSLTITLSKPDRSQELKKAAEPSPRPAKDPRATRIIDTPGITEQFANQVLDVFLVNGHTVSMTFGTKRTVRENTFSAQETVIAVNNRLTLDLAAAEALLNALNTVLNMAKNPVSKPPKVTLN
jgi:hypothetical protein